MQLLNRRKLLLVVLFVGLAITVGVLAWMRINNDEDRSNGLSNIETKTESVDVNKNTKKAPTLKTTVVESGLIKPWDIAEISSGRFLVSEKSGLISLIERGKTKVPILQISDVYNTGEGGLMGIVLDSEFANNRYVYGCFNSDVANSLDVRVVRWKLTKNEELTDRKDIVTGIPSNTTGRHSGCRLAFANNGLWVGTGDAAIATTPQNPTSLGGKILRVDRNGKAVAGNLTTPFDGRIFSYGHRNTQGLVVFSNPIDGNYGFSVEHGSDVDDEVNLLKKGNFGWSPVSPYQETGVSMTDKRRFPEAISAVWISGKPTIAPSGAAVLRGNNWGSWEGSLAVAVLKGKHVRIMKFDQNNKLVLEKEVLNQFGRIRSANMSSDNKLYLTTDNGKDDKLIMIEAST